MGGAGTLIGDSMGQKRWKWICQFKDYVGEDKEVIEIHHSPYEFSKDWLYNLDIENWFYDLKRFRCRPSLRLCGAEITTKKWRVNINQGTDIWAESDDIAIAFRKAFKKWVAAKMPTAQDSAISLWVKEHVDGKRKRREVVWRII